MIVAVDCRESALDGPFEQGHSDGGCRHLLDLTASGVKILWLYPFLPGSVLGLDHNFIKIAWGRPVRVRK